MLDVKINVTVLKNQEGHLQMKGKADIVNSYIAQKFPDGEPEEQKNVTTVSVDILIDKDIKPDFSKVAEAVDQIRKATQPQFN